ncbi:arsenate reductase family protein [Tumebacillus lipolyticus]|uniref:Arsenate reductase family protein n=1 Tax=Tumebacillus lipolyticus TaxID=1280370 RepID=A0ABW4ZVZ7_9BACL
MEVTMMYHPACSKTPRARDFLANEEVKERNLVEEMLSAEEILEIASSLGLKVQDLLRPSSPVYQERHEELYKMAEAELSALMATEPTLVKRPIVKTDRGYVIGMDEAKITELLRATKE